MIRNEGQTESWFVGVLVIMNTLEQWPGLFTSLGEVSVPSPPPTPCGRFEVPDVSKDRSKLLHKNRIALHKYGHTFKEK